jgi:hypothetical protein
MDQLPEWRGLITLPIQVKDRAYSSFSQLAMGVTRALQARSQPFGQARRHSTTAGLQK